jgi:hypothetical protein
MKRRRLNDEQRSILRRILTGGHPSPGSGYLGWPQEASNDKLILLIEKEELDKQLKHIQALRRRAVKRLNKLKEKK